MLMPYIAGGWLPTDPSSLHDIGQGTGPVAPDSSIRRYPSHFVIWTRILGEAYRRCRRTGSACTFCLKIKERSSNTQTENSRRPSARTYPRRPESRKCNRKEGGGSGTARFWGDMCRVTRTGSSDDVCSFRLEGRITSYRLMGCTSSRLPIRSTFDCGWTRRPSSLASIFDSGSRGLALLEIRDQDPRHRSHQKISWDGR